ncbi:MAG: IS1 family transposase [bacterium]|nr:IS1 family transposase [bacterium]
MDEKIRGISSSEIQIDEAWCYVKKRDRALRTDDGPEVGGQYVFVALDANTKLIPCFAIGKRDQATALRLMKSLDERVVTRFQLTTDSFPGFLYAVADVFGWHGIDYAQINKRFAGASTPVREGYGPSKFIRVRKVPIMGYPDPKRISTSYIERQNLTMRMQMRRFTRLTNAFSKKLENLKAAVALHFAWYNFVRVHQTLGTTPAVAAGVADRVWTIGELVT